MFSYDNDLEGTCCATYLYNLGSAHGYTKAADQAEWDNWCISVLPRMNRVIVAFTNFRQDKEREYMTAQGWTTTRIDQTSMYVSTISRDKLDLYLRGVKEQIKAKQEELKRIEAERVSKFKQAEPLKVEPVETVSRVKRVIRKKTTKDTPKLVAGGQARVKTTAKNYALGYHGQIVTLGNRVDQGVGVYWTIGGFRSFWETDLEPV